LIFCYDREQDMAASMDFSPPFTLLEGGYNNNVSENLENLKQPTNGKPPCHLRQSMDSVRLLNASDLVSKKEIDDWMCF
jgi:protein phosphatase 2C family protein 2/3